MKGVALFVSAIVTVLLGLYFGPLDNGSGDQRAPDIAVPGFPSVESQVSLREGPKVEKTHAGMGEEPFEVRGEVRPNGVPGVLPMATPSQPGCTTRLLSTNFSSRAGVRPSMFVLHYTVSANRVGLSDVEAIFNFFNRSSSQASSHYIIDFEGNCWLIVAEGNKAWTQGSFNPSSISIEFIATGSEPREAWEEAGLRKGARVVADALKRWDIPRRWVDPVDCTVKAGITDHNNLECGNTHFDVQPNFPYAKFLRYVEQAYLNCFRYQIRDNGKVLAESPKFRGKDRVAKLATFLDNQNERLVRRLFRDDFDVALRRSKAACG